MAQNVTIAVNHLSVVVGQSIGTFTLDLPKNPSLGIVANVVTPDPVNCFLSVKIGGQYSNSLYATTRHPGFNEYELFIGQLK